MQLNYNRCDALLVVILFLVRARAALIHNAKVMSDFHIYELCFQGDYDVVINDYEKAKSLFGNTEVPVFKKGTFVYPPFVSVLTNKGGAWGKKKKESITIFLFLLQSLRGGRDEDPGSPQLTTGKIAADSLNAA